MVKEVQQLTERISAINRFLPKAAFKALPLYTLLWKGKEFMGIEEDESTFNSLKDDIITSPPVLSSQVSGEILYLYLAIRNKAISSAWFEKPHKDKSQYTL